MSAKARTDMFSISIHVPAWGTTLDHIHCILSIHNFNPRSRVGNDFPAVTGRSEEIVFQSTFPRGERPTSNAVCACATNISIHVPAWGTTAVENIAVAFLTNFNPRSRVGNDHAFSTSCMRKRISIHVPAWGTTGIKFIANRHTVISIHVPAWGTTAWIIGGISE